MARDMNEVTKCAWAWASNDESIYNDLTRMTAEDDGTGLAARMHDYFKELGIISAFMMEKGAGVRCGFMRALIETAIDEIDYNFLADGFRDMA